jgi:hypothetical protein
LIPSEKADISRKDNGVCVNYEEVLRHSDIKLERNSILPKTGEGGKMEDVQKP